MVPSVVGPVASPGKALHSPRRQEGKEKGVIVQERQERE